MYILWVNHNMYYICDTLIMLWDSWELLTDNDKQAAKVMGNLPFIKELMIARGKMIVNDC
jgi:hypothetical protein